MEVLPFVLYLIDKNLKLNSGAVLGVDKLVDDLVELIRTLVKVHKQISELSEDELFPLSVLEEEQGNKILRRKLDKFFSSHDFLLAEVISEHESVHGCVQLDLIISLPLELVFDSEDFHNLLGQVLIDILSEVILINVFTHFKIELDVFDVLEFFLVLSHGSTDKAMFVQFFLGAIF